MSAADIAIFKSGTSTVWQHSARVLERVASVKINERMWVAVIHDLAHSLHRQPIVSDAIKVQATVVMPSQNS